MSLTSLLLLSMIMAAPSDRTVQPVQSREAVPAIVATQNAPILPEGNFPSPSTQLTSQAPGRDSSQAMSNDICYKIRAYIFRRDDDHAPELVRSTTCGPRPPHTKAADWPKAKLVPAD